jgi:RimJ/RimL family protein N-acetyltransferase
VRLVLERCVLRSWHTGDIAALVRHADNRKIWRNVRDRFPHPYTRAEAEAWVRLAALRTPETAFAIDVGGEAVGGIGLELQEDVYRRSAEIGYWLGEAHWGRGIATDAVRGPTAWTFEHFDVCRIFAKVFEWNPASARVLEKAGYVQEGRLRRAVTKDGHLMDELLYAAVKVP